MSSLHGMLIQTFCLFMVIDKMRNERDGTERLVMA
jgi:hypothetical protein